MLAAAKINTFDEEKQMISLDLTWRNSWRNDTNFDGVYVFFKYKHKAQYGYESMKLAAGSEGAFNGSNAAPEGFYIGEGNIKTGVYAPETKLGFFVFPEEKCSKQEVCVKNIKVPVAAKDVEQIEVFAIEMVYIPEGGFCIGDPKGPLSKGGQCINGFYTYPDGPTYHVASNDAIEFGKEEGMMFCDEDNPNGRTAGIDRFTIPKAYPKGYKAMWYMKHPLTMGQWVKFLNCLTRKQQQTQVRSDISGDEITNYYVMTNSDHEQDRCAMFCKPYENGTEAPIKVYTSAPHRIANAVDWFSTCSFACFAGLRPLTELEFVKACRGPLKPADCEFAWGSSHIGRVWNFEANEDDVTDRPIPEKKGTLANCNFDVHSVMLQGKPKPFTGTAPEWGGCVSESTFENAPLVEGYSERECMGASYYGVMELSGNTWEYVISVGNEEGRKFDGSLGSGELTEDGLHNMPTWPDPNTGVGLSQKGGSYVSTKPPRFFVDSRPFGTFAKKAVTYHGGVRVGL